MVLQPTYNYVEDHFYENNFLYLKKKKPVKDVLHSLRIDN